MVTRAVECRSLSSVHGIPKVHFKGKHKEYYIMVRCNTSLHPFSLSRHAAPFPADAVGYIVRHTQQLGRVAFRIA